LGSIARADLDVGPGEDMAELDYLAVGDILPKLACQLNLIVLLL